MPRHRSFREDDDAQGSLLLGSGEPAAMQPPEGTQSADQPSLAEGSPHEPDTGNKRAPTCTPTIRRLSRILSPDQPIREQHAAESCSGDASADSRNMNLATRLQEQHAAPLLHMNLRAWKELIPILRGIREAAHEHTRSPHGTGSSDYGAASPRRGVGAGTMGDHDTDQAQAARGDSA